jgi:hypothetical protein
MTAQSCKQQFTLCTFDPSPSTFDGHVFVLPVLPSTSDPHRVRGVVRPKRPRVQRYKLPSQRCKLPIHACRGLGLMVRRSCTRSKEEVVPIVRIASHLLRKTP